MKLKLKPWVPVSAAAAVLMMAGCSSTSVSKDESSPGEAVAAAEIREATPVAQSAVEPVTIQPMQRAQEVSIAGVPRLVYFDYDESVIKPEFHAMIDAHARWLRADRSRKIVIQGHADERGGREYNLALGQRRADALRQRFHLLGVTDAQIETVSFGEEKPIVAESNEAAWSQNRRDEIVYR